MNFHNIIKVNRQDWKRIMKNPVAIIILAGLCVLPSLYAWVNIQACWNVYENTNSIPVAVVNNDKDAHFKDKKINVGNEIVSQLKKNNKIKWIFTNSQDADMGLVDSTYYAMIEIPSDFSSKILTVLTANPQKPQIIYKVDTKANPVASKITSTANNTLIQQVSSEFISTVNETAFASLNVVGKNASKNKEDIIKVKDSVVSINRNMSVITSSLDGIGKNSDNLNEFLESISATMPAVQSGLASVGKNNADNQKILQSMQTSMDDSIKNVDLNLNYAQMSNEKIRNLFSSLNDSASNASASKINTVLPTISTQIESMNSSIDATIDYLKQCNSYDYNSDIDYAISSLTKLKTDLTNLRKSLVDMQTQLRNLSGSLDQLYAYLDKEIPQIEKDLDSVDSALTSTISQLETLNDTLNSPELTQVINALKAIQTSGLKEQLVTVLNEIKNSEPQVKAALKSLDDTITTVIQQIDKANSNIDTAVKFLQSAKSSNAVKKQQISNIISDLQATKPYITDEQNQITNIRSQLNAANSIAKSTADLVNSDSGRIATQLNNSIQLYNSEVKDDLKTIGDNLIVTLKDASGLIQNAQDLSTQISSMVDTAREGSGLVSEFSTSINDKLTEFKDVISSLGSKFEQVNNNDISEIISILQNDPKLMGDYVSNPFDIKEESINSIPNYGTGMSPIYTTLALWVGCLVLNSILKPKAAYFEGIEQVTLREKHFGKMLLFSTLAVIQGLIVSLGDIFLLKIYVVNPALFIFFAVYSSLVFSIVTFTLASTLGNVGKALSIIYLILQVAGSGGSYPIQVDPLVFRILQPLFPFTYTLGGLREAIAGPLVSSVMMNIAALAVFAALFLVGGYFTVGPLNNTIHQFEHDFKKSGLGE
ncbi:MAG TPA: YhgE/Pip domain-containing protein [Caproicibacter sp.]|nr:YhgE/Pip domain-containing protein [Caproicibacter sp.]